MNTNVYITFDQIICLIEGIEENSKYLSLNILRGV
jgi:hypothetical protein